MLNGKIIKEAFTFDDVLLVPAYSEVLPHQVKLQTLLTKNITLNIPLLSAAMDTVTESAMGISMALEGGIGMIHKNMSIAAQVTEITRVKNHSFNQNDYPNACVDKDNKLRIGAAIGVSTDLDDRVKALYDAGVDIVTLDSAHGHSKGIINALTRIKKSFPKLDVIAGNIVTASAAQSLVDAGADAVKVGVGPGAICTTRVVAGVGVPQLTAINDIFEQLRNQQIGIIADGGIQSSGDIAKAIAVGAHCVMMGSMLAGTDEAPGDIVTIDGKKYKSYVGMGSMVAMERGSKDRYFQQGKENKKLVPEGIEAVVNYKGKVQQRIFQLIGGLRAGMGYCGAASINKMRFDARLVRITNAGLTERPPHDVLISKDAPNYKK